MGQPQCNLFTVKKRFWPPTTQDSIEFSERETLTLCVGFWPKAPLRFRRNLIQTLKFRLSAMNLSTAGQFCQVGERNPQRCTDSNRPGADLHGHETRAAASSHCRPSQDPTKHALSRVALVLGLTCSFFIYHFITIGGGQRLH